MTERSGSYRSALWPIHIGLISLMVLVVGLGTWSVATQISGAVIAPGRLAVERHRQVVQHPTGGMVQAVDVSEGDFVSAGDVIMRLDTRRLHAELADLTSQHHALASARVRLEAVRDHRDRMTVPSTLVAAAETTPELRQVLQAEQALFVASKEAQAQQRARLLKQRDQVRAQMQGLQARRDAQQAQLGLIAKELRDQQALLTRGLAQARSVWALEREQMRLIGLDAELAATLRRDEARLAELQIALDRLRTESRAAAIEALGDVIRRQRDVTHQRDLVTAELDQMTLRAPVAGQVFGLTVHAPGAVLRPAEVAFSLIPDRRPLIVAAQVQPTHVDQVYLDQPVKLRFSALDQRNALTLTGRVTHISADLIEDPGRRAPHFRVEVALLPQERALLDPEVRLLPGMPVEVFLQLDERTPLAYLVQPFTDFFARALRES